MHSGLHEGPSEVLIQPGSPGPDICTLRPSDVIILYICVLELQSSDLILIFFFFIRPCLVSNYFIFSVSTADVIILLPSSGLALLTVVLTFHVCGGGYVNVCMCLGLILA